MTSPVTTASCPTTAFETSVRSASNDARACSACACSVSSGICVMSR